MSDIPKKLFDAATQFHGLGYTTQSFHLSASWNANKERVDKKVYGSKGWELTTHEDGLKHWSNIPRNHNAIAVSQRKMVIERVISGSRYRDNS